MTDPQAPTGALSFPKVRRRPSLVAIVVAAVMLLVFGAGFSALFAGLATATEAMGVRFGTSAEHTRIVIDLKGKATPKILAPAEGDKAFRLVFSGVELPGFTTGRGQGAVTTWEADQDKRQATFSFELSDDVVVRRSFLLKPGTGVDHYRFVVDLAPRNMQAPGQSNGQVINAVFAPPHQGKRVVVIDAGHGGRDPGAVAKPHSVHEKDVNLDAAKVLKRQLERTGRYKVVMTREDDTFIPLKDRVRKARGANADLFISLHADSGPKGAEGASVYTLSEKASSRVARSIVNGQNWILDAKELRQRDQDVTRILVDLTQRETKNQSARFAQTLTQNLKPVTPLLRNTHRNAGFVVLLAPDVPAVLLEMGVLSSEKDLKRLKDKNNRANMMAAVARSIDDYFESNPARVANLH